MDSTIFLQRMRQTRAWIFILLLMSLILTSAIAQEWQDAKNLNPVRKPNSLARLAVVIGNATYENVAPLQNTINDAQDMRDMLKKLGFEVIYCENATRSEMQDILTKLAEKSAGKEIVFYYSGHGTQIADRNYLLPVNVKAINESTLKTSSLELQSILDAMFEAKTKIVILDACRDNPYAKSIGRNVGRGLAKVTESPQETLIIYATDAGKIASDNPNGRNGMFTQYLLKYIPKPGMEVVECMREVTREVREKTKDTQIPQNPCLYFSMVGKFYFNPSQPDSSNANTQPPTVPTEETETVIVEPEEVVKKMELETELKISKDGKQTWYDIKIKNKGSAGKIKVTLIFPKGLKYETQEGSINWPEMEIQTNKIKLIPYKGFNAVSPGKFAVECQVYEGEELRSRVVQEVEIEARLFPSDNPRIVQPDLPRIVQPHLVTPRVETPTIRLTSPLTVIPSAHSYNLPSSIWPSCCYQQDGENILDMTTITWRNLSWQEQTQHAKTYQAGYAAAKGLQVRKVYTVSGVLFQMQLIPPGVYLIGSPSEEVDRDSDEPQTRIVISQPFYMGETEVTQAQWEAVMGSNSSYFKDNTLPAENMPWADAIKFCVGMARKTGESGWRLPLEMEWEYVCRAGATTPFNIGPNISTSAVNYNGNSPYNEATKGRYRQRTVPCASLNNSNAWNLYDMHGNVSEWCLEEWGKSYSETVQNSKNILLNQFQNINHGYRVARGGSWSRSAARCRSAFRDRYSNPDGSVGCRLLKSLD